jgi:hypothetical protein
MNSIIRVNPPSANAQARGHHGKKCQRPPRTAGPCDADSTRSSESTTASGAERSVTTQRSLTPRARSRHACTRRGPAPSRSPRPQWATGTAPAHRPWAAGPPAPPPPPAESRLAPAVASTGVGGGGVRGGSRRVAARTRRAAGRRGAAAYSATLDRLLRAQPLVVRRRVSTPSHQIACNAPLLLAVEQQLHLVLALLPRVVEEGLEPVYVDCIHGGSAGV